MFPCWEGYNRPRYQLRLLPSDAGVRGDWQSTQCFHIGHKHKLYKTDSFKSYISIIHYPYFSISTTDLSTINVIYISVYICQYHINISYLKQTTKLPFRGWSLPSDMNHTLVPPFLVCPTASSSRDLLANTFTML